MAPRLRSLSIACVLDGRAAWEIATGRTRGTNASYDLSVVKALRRMYRTVHLVRAVPNSARTLEDLSRLHPDVIFNLAFSANRLEAPFAGALDLLGIPFTGSGSTAIALANDKVRSRILLRNAGVRVPRFAELNPESSVDIDFEPPYIVKPSCLAGSAGIHADSVVKTRADVMRLAARIWRRFQMPAVCDEFIVGREIRVGVVEDSRGNRRVAGISEWRFDDDEMGWGFKTEAIRSNLRVRRARRVRRGIVTLTAKTARTLRSIVRESMHVLGLAGYATIDVRIDTEQRLNVLEINANPGLWAGGSVWSHPSFDTNIRRVVEAAIRTQVR